LLHTKIIYVDVRHSVYSWFFLEVSFLLIGICDFMAELTKVSIWYVLHSKAMTEVVDKEPKEALPDLALWDGLQEALKIGKFALNEIWTSFNG
jgi:hypothetical protein